MKHIAFKKVHPAVAALFFLVAIACGTVILHPLYLLVGLTAAVCCVLSVEGPRGLIRTAGVLPICLIMALINPLFNTAGEQVLFSLWGRPYTLEALLYGAVLAGMLLEALLWLRCLTAVLTGDRLVHLLGSLFPAGAMLLVTVLRLIPLFGRKARQVLAARSAIGLGAAAGDSLKRRLSHGMTAAAALTGWALEGSVVTGDSMLSRGYGTGRRSSFQIYRFTRQDGVLLGLILLLAAGIAAAGGTHASFIPRWEGAAPNWGLAAYGTLLLLPTLLQIKESVLWHCSASKI